MPKQITEPKIKVSVGLTPRLVTMISAEAKRLGVPDSDVMRRGLDFWADSIEAQHRKMAPADGPIRVLDRTSNQILTAR